MRGVVGVVAHAALLRWRFIAGALLLVLISAIAWPLGGASAAVEPYFRVGFDASAGPLRLGMPYAAARRYLSYGDLVVVSGGVTCKHYNIELHSTPGDVYACFDRTAHLVAFRVSGNIFCFRRGICLDAQGVLPKTLRAGIHMRFDRSNGVYYGFRSERLLGRAYGVMIQRPSFYRRWTVKWIGFAPLTNAKVRFFMLSYVPYGP